MNNPIHSESTTTIAPTPVFVDRGPAGILPIWKPKSALERSHKVATFGSCFAQHLAVSLRERGYNWFDAEPAPDIFSPEVKAKHNFGVFSARTGEISTAAALRQWISWAIGTEAPPTDEIWQQGSRFLDPFRSFIEPNGFAGPDELLASRESTLRALRKVIAHADRFVVTLSNTAGWIHSSKGHVYSDYPGLIARNIGSAEYCLKNFSSSEIETDLTWIMQSVSKINVNARFVFTVSATLPATAASETPPTGVGSSSKAMLCAAARSVADKHALANYYPAYEIMIGVESGIVHSASLTGSKPGLSVAIDHFFSSLNPAVCDTRAVPEPAMSGDADKFEVADAYDFWWRVLKIRNDMRGLF